MSAAQPSVLEQIAAKLKEANQEEAQRNYASTIFTLTKSLETAPPATDEFTKFITETHDIMIKGDSSKRCSILRAIRYCLVNKDAVQVVLENEVHYVVVSSLEKDGDSAVERMQALKIMERVHEIAPEMYPVAFARSLVAVANFKEDSFRKICIETLRELALKNPEMVVAVDGFVPMMDAVVEPITQPLADSIVLTVIYLLNDPATRAVVAHGVDLRLLLAPLTDLDSSASDLSAKWKACKSALVLLMRSWVGLIQLAADDMAWPTLVRMLRDLKVPLATQEIILDTISDIFEPVSSKVKQIRTGRGNRHSVGLCEEQDPASQPSGAGPGLPLSPGGKQVPNAVEGRSRPTSERIQGSPSMVEGGSGKGGVGIGYRNSGLSDPPPPAGRYQIRNDQPAYETPTKTPEAKATTHRSSFAWGGGASSSNSATAQAGQNLVSPQTRRTFSVTNFFTHRDNKAKGVPPTAPTSGAGSSGAPQRRGSHTNATPSTLASLQGPVTGPGKAQDDSALPLSGEMSTLMKIFHLRKRRSSKEGGDPRSLRAESPSAVSVGSLSNSDLRLAGIFNEQEALMDPIFNLMDNYKALLCCAFLHANLIESLYFLGVNGATQIALKSRRLMVNFLRTLAFLFPEDMCSELLTIPTLIEFAASVSSTRMAKRAHKSSQMLITLAEAFSLMPFKQVSGNHISGLSLTAKLQRPSVAGGVAASGPAGKTNTPVTNPSPAVAARANLPPLNIQTIFELAEEIKISSFSTTASGESTVDGSSSIVAGVNGGGTATEMLNALRNSLTPEIDKNDFVKQMDLSRVIGNVGKEPFKWDWMTISDMLEYSFCNPSRLSEALKTKWVRRVSGFYRCSVEEKGYFANLDWEPIHLQYLECACNLYRVLLKDEAGMAFLTQDRRGMLFNEIAHEIDNLTVAAASTNVTAQSAALQRNVFRLYSCQCTMAREFFTLLGRIVHNTGSKHLMQGTSIFVNLQKLGQYRSLDYASRLVLTSLSFTDGGVMSKVLLQQWTQKSGCTAELRTYAHTLLRILLRSGAGVEAFAWRIDAIAAQLEGSRVLHTPTLYQALQEAVHDKSNLRAIIAKRPKLLDNPAVQRILIRFLSIAEGIEYLSFDKNGERTYKEGADEPTSWLSDELESWKTTKCQQYVAEVDQALTLAFAQCDNKVETISADPVIQGASGLEPIPLQTMEFLSELAQRGGGSGSGGSSRGDEPSSATHSTVRLGNGDGHGSSENSWYTRDPNSSLLVDLHGLVRVPWNIEVKVASSTIAAGSGAGYSKDLNYAPISNSAPITSSTVIQQSPGGEYLRVDSFLDAAYLPSPLCYDVTSDQNNLIKVRGVVLDNRGFPTGHPVPYNKVVSATLLAGVCPITRTGRALSPGEMKVQRRKTTTVSEGAYEAVSRMSAIVPPSNASLAESPLPNGANSYDLPVSYHLDAPYDWTTCKSSHRQNNSTELPDGLFSVTVPGEPVVLIFSRRSPSNTTSGNSTSMRLGRGTSIGVNQLPTVSENSGRPPSSTPKAGGKVSSGGVVWLVEVQYFFRLETGQAIFVPMPSHIYGELTRTIEGCEVLAKRKVVSELLAKARQLYNVCTMAVPTAGRVTVLSPASSTNTTAPLTPQTPLVDTPSSRAEVLAAYKELQAALWSLGHIGSNELGCALILEADRRFVTWCIEGVYSCTYYSLRATFFYVLGLLSRTQQGSRRLLKHGWDSAPRDGNSAVAFPLRASNLFRHSGAIASASPPSPRGQGSPHNKFPFSPLGPTPTSPISRASSKGGAFTAPSNALTTNMSSATAPASTTVNNFSGLSIYTAGPLPPPPRNAALSPSNLGVMSPPRLNTLPDSVLSHLNVYNRTSLQPNKNLEIEALHLIAKLPGVIVYKDCKARLDHMRKEHPELFAQRGLYLQVHRMLESYTFKLNARREILALFSDEARVKTPAAD